MTYCGRRGVCVGVDVPLPGNPGVTTKSTACVCASDATARITTTGGYGQAAAYCEPTRLDLDTSADGGATLLQAACEGFDCGAHGACVSMNGNPSCQCEAGYGAVVSTTYAPTTGNPIRQISCEAVTVSVPPLPVVPPVGQTKIPDPRSGSGGSSASGVAGKASQGAGGASSGPVSSGGSPGTSGGTGPASAPSMAKSESTDSGCSLSGHSARSSAPLFGFAALLALGLRRRRAPSH
jgi:hypothetical protein